MKNFIMKNSTLLIYIGVVLFLVFIDQITKYYVFKYFELGHNKCIPKVIDFTLLYNEGAIFGILQGKQVFFFIITILGLGLFGYMLKDGNFKTYPFYTIGLLLVIAGTLGNFIDRVFLGKVRDFIDFAFFNFASFNFADMCMCVGVTMILIDILFGNVGEKWK